LIVLYGITILFSKSKTKFYIKSISYITEVVSVEGTN